MIVMRINFKKYTMNFGQLILMKIFETAATRQHILKLTCTKFDFGCGLLRGKQLFGLQARRWYGQQIGLPICLFTSSEDSHFRQAPCSLHSAVHCPLWMWPAVQCCCSCKHDPFISDF